MERLLACPLPSSAIPIATRSSPTATWTFLLPRASTRQSTHDHLRPAQSESSQPLLSLPSRTWTWHHQRRPRTVSCRWMSRLRPLRLQPLRWPYRRRLCRRTYRLCQRRTSRKPQRKSTRWKRRMPTSICRMRSESTKRRSQPGPSGPPGDPQRRQVRRQRQLLPLEDGLLDPVVRHAQGRQPLLRSLLLPTTQDLRRGRRKCTA